MVTYVKFLGSIPRTGPPPLIFGPPDNDKWHTRKPLGVVVQVPQPPSGPASFWWPKAPAVHKAAKPWRKRSWYLIIAAAAVITSGSGGHTASEERWATKPVEKIIEDGLHPHPGPRGPDGQQDGEGKDQQNRTRAKTIEVDTEDPEVTDAKKYKAASRRRIIGKRRPDDEEYQVAAENKRSKEEDARGGEVFTDGGNR